MELAFLRLLHLCFGFLWAGGAVIMGLWVIPAVVAAGPAGGAVMQGVVVDRKLPQVLTVSGLITVLCGLRLYMLKFSMGWLTTPEGIALSLGGLLGIAAFFIGVMVQRPRAAQVAALGAEIAASGGPPSAEQQAKMAELQGKLVRTGKVLAWHLVASVVLMSAMRLTQMMAM